MSLARVLLALKEFEAARQIVSAIMPGILETEDCAKAAECYSCLADAHMGLAGAAGVGSKKRREQMNKTLTCLEQAFDEFSRTDDVQGQCETMAKRATIMHLTGDLVLANDYAAKYRDLRTAAQEGMQT